MQCFFLFLFLFFLNVYACVYTKYLDTAPFLWLAQQEFPYFVQDRMHANYDSFLCDYH